MRKSLFPIGTLIPNGYTSPFVVADNRLHNAVAHRCLTGSCRTIRGPPHLLSLQKTEKGNLSRGNFENAMS